MMYGNKTDHGPVEREKHREHDKEIVSPSTTKSSGSSAEFVGDLHRFQSQNLTVRAAARVRAKQ